MTQYEYKVDSVSTITSAKAVNTGKAVSQLSTDVEAVIKRHTAQGYEMYQMVNLMIEGKPGCFSLGRNGQSNYTSVVSLVFRREVVH